VGPHHKSTLLNEVVLTWFVLYGTHAVNLSRHVLHQIKILPSQDSVHCQDITLQNFGFYQARHIVNGRLGKACSIVIGSLTQEGSTKDRSLMLLLKSQRRTVISIEADIDVGEK
jgi:hypothetical protein